MRTVGALAGAALAAAMSSAMADNVKSAAKLNAQLGLDPAATARAGKVAGEVYASNFGASFADVNSAVRSVVTGIGADINDVDLSSLTKKALTLVDVFDQDLASSTEAVGALMRSGLAKDAAEAFDVITTGFQRGADRSGDFLDTLREYSSQFQKFGLDARTSTGLLSQGMAAGARNSDLVADAIKEFSIRSVDGTKLTAEGFQGIGLSAGKMAKEIGAGGERASKALDLTLDRLRAVKDPVKQSQLAVALFGTQAEDLGKSLFALDPSNAVSALGEVSGAADAAADAVGGGLIATLETLSRTALAKLTELSVTLNQQLPNLWISLSAGDAGGIGEVLDNIFGNSGTKIEFFTSLGEKLLPVFSQVTTILGSLLTVAQQLGGVLGLGLAGAAGLVWQAFTAILPLLVSVTSFLAENRGLVLTLAGAYVTLRLAMLAHAAVQAVTTAGGVTAWLKNWIGQMQVAQAVQKAWTAVQWLFNAAMSANPLVKIIGIIALVVGALITAYQTSDTFRGIVQTAFKAVGDAATWLWENVLSPTWSALTTAWNAVATAFQWAWENILKPVLDVIGSVMQGLAIFLMIVVLGPLMLAWKGLTEAMAWAWENILKPALDDLVAFAQWLWVNFLQPLFVGIGVQWRELMDGMSWVWENILKPVWNAIQAAASWLWDNFLQPMFVGIGVQWRELMDGIAWVWEHILKPVWNAIQTAAQWLWDNFLQPLFVGIGVQWRELMDGMDWAWENILKPVFDAVGSVLDVLKSSFDTAVAFIGRVWDGLKDKLMAPVRWTVDFVWNNGLRKLWNWINDLWGGEDLKEFKLASGGVLPQHLGNYATGGVLPGYTPGRDVHRFVSPTGGILNLSGGEAVMRPEFVRAMGLHGVNALNAAARTGGARGVANALAARTGYEQSHAEGGVINLPGWLSTALDWIPGGGFVTDIVKKINGGDGFGAGQWAGALVGTVKQVGSKVWEKIKSWFDSDSGGSFGASNPSPNGVGGLGPMAAAARDFVMRTWGISNIGGYANRNIAGTGTPSDHALGKAIDVMISNYKSPAGIGLGNSVANWFVANPGRFGTKYVIWRDRINQGRGWEPYGHPGGGRSDTLQHRDHVHVSVYDDGGVLEPGLTPVLNKSGKPEAILTNEEWGVIRRLADGGGAGALVGGDLVLQVRDGASVRDQMDEAMFQLRRIQRGGALR